MAPKILDASLIPLEKALLARAEALRTVAGQDPGSLVSMVKAGIALEFLALAEELRNQ